MFDDDKKDVEFLEQHLEAHPDSLLFARLADNYLQMNRVDEALQLCETGVQKHPYYASGHFVLGKTYLTKEMHEQAEKEFKRVLLFDPKFLAAHKLYGDLMKKIGWENTYELSYKKILQIDPLEKAALGMIGDQINESAIDEITDSIDRIGSAKIQSAAEQTAASAKTEEMESGTEDPFAKSVSGDAEEPALDSDPAARAQGKPEVPEQTGEPPFEDMVEQESDFETQPKGSAPVATIEDDLLFAEPETDESQDESSFEIFGDPAGTAGQGRPAGMESELDDQKAEKFSYILDDIFKEDAVENPRAQAPDDAEQEPDKSSGDDPDDFLTEFQLSQSISQSTEEEVEPDAEKQSTAQFDFAEPEPPEKAPSKTPASPANPFAEKPFDYPITPSEPPKQEKKQTQKRRKKKHDKMVTPTLGEIYAAQGQYGKALDVFETLIKKHPENEFYNKKIEDLKQKLAESQ